MSDPSPHDKANHEGIPTQIHDVVQRVLNLENEDMGTHVEAFERAHQVLQEQLTEAVDG